MVAKETAPLLPADVTGLIANGGNVAAVRQLLPCQHEPGKDAGLPGKDADRPGPIVESPRRKAIRPDRTRAGPFTEAGKLATSGAGSPTAAISRQTGGVDLQHRLAPLRAVRRDERRTRCHRHRRLPAARKNAGSSVRRAPARRRPTSIFRSRVPVTKMPPSAGPWSRVTASADHPSVVDHRQAELVKKAAAQIRIALGQQFAQPPVAVKCKVQPRRCLAHASRSRRNATSSRLFSVGVSN